MIASPKNFIEQFQNFIEHIAGVMKTFLTKEVADNYYLSFIAQTLNEAQKTQARTNIGAISLSDVPSVLSMYPVGSIYMSADANFNPNTAFGGTWVKIENRFLLASGTKGVGWTGGEENVTLNGNQIPAHNHGNRGTMNIVGYPGLGWNASGLSDFGQIGVFTYLVQSRRTLSAGGIGNWDRQMYFDAARNWSGESGYYGGSQAHNNMPPYEVVAIWKRTA